MKNQKLTILTPDKLVVNGKIRDGVITIYLEPIFDDYKEIVITVIPRD